jgi:hypothetical protein
LTLPHHPIFAELTRNNKQQTAKNNKRQTTNDKQQTTNNKRQTTNDEQQTTNDKRQTTNNKQQTAKNKKQETTNGEEQQTAKNNKRETTNDEQQTTNNKRQTTNDEQQTRNKQQETTNNKRRRTTNDEQQTTNNKRQTTHDKQKNTMAKQTGAITLQGSIGNTTFFKNKHGYMAMEKSGVSKAQIMKDPRFERTRQNMTEFGHANKAGKTLRNAIKTLLLKAKDPTVCSRLAKEIMEVLKTDEISIRGQRNVLHGQIELLQGFEFNNNATLYNTLATDYHPAIDRVAGTLTLNIPSYHPLAGINAPRNTTHYKIVTIGAEVDFENEKFKPDVHETAFLPWNDTPTPTLNIVNTVTANSAHPLFLLLGIQFYDQINGMNFPIKNTSANPLQIVKVSRGGAM